MQEICELCVFRQRSHEEGEKPALASSVPSTVPSTWSVLSNNLEQPQSDRIAKQFVEVRCCL